MTRLGDLLRYTRVTAIVGDILKIRADDVGLGDMALVEMADGDQTWPRSFSSRETKCRCKCLAVAKGCQGKTAKAALVWSELLREAPEYQPAPANLSLLGSETVASGGERRSSSQPPPYLNERNPDAPSIPNVSQKKEGKNKHGSDGSHQPNRIWITEGDCNVCGTTSARLRARRSRSRAAPISSGPHDAKPVRDHPG